ncbi:MAG: glutaredoxin family protein [Betaproteobacteria bacterium]|nr:glutaredoxin family protein [Betaproteobacteria bacterium]
MPARYRLPALFAVAMVFSALAAAQANVFRWVDKDGKVHYSDTPPPEPAKSLTQKRVGGGYAESSQLPYATQIAMKKSPVTMYSGADCGDPCKQGRDLLVKRGIPFGERDAQANAEDAEALKKLVGAIEVPVLVVGASKVKGYEEGAWHSALDGAGYPRTALPGQVPPRPPAAPVKAVPAAAPPPAPDAAAAPK